MVCLGTEPPEVFTGTAAGGASAAPAGPEPVQGQLLSPLRPDRIRCGVNPSRRSDRTGSDAGSTPLAAPAGSDPVRGQSSSCIRVLRMSTVSFGTSPNDPREPVSTAAIRSTVSMPSTTRPKAA